MSSTSGHEDAEHSSAPLREPERFGTKMYTAARHTLENGTTALARIFALFRRRAPSEPVPCASDACLRELCARVLPVWSRQVDGARRAADKAVARLSGLFGGIVDNLEAALRLTRGAEEGEARERREMRAAVEATESDLKAMVAELRGLEQNRDTLHREMQRHANDFRAMSALVEQAALRMRLVAINAAIESAQAGGDGRAFAIVANEMRQLAGQLADTSKQMTRQVEAIAADAAAMSRGGTTGHETAAAKADAVVGRVLERFQGLVAGASGARREAEAERERIRDQLADALVALQFQDRVSQILQHVQAGIDQVSRRVDAEREAGPDVAGWLRDISRDYTTAEEFAKLDGADAPEASPQAVRYF